MHQPILPEGIQEDRRRPEGLLLSIMSHVSDRIEEVERRHEERYKALDAKITNLTDSINSYIDKEPDAILEKCEEMIDEMVPSHPENTDATPAEKRKEHRRAHARWISRVMKEEDEIGKLWLKVKEVAVIGLLGIIALALWQYLLRGPK